MQAKKIITEVAPFKLIEFDAAIDVLQTQKNFEIKSLKNFLDLDLQQEISRLIQQMPKGELERHEFLRFGRMIIDNHNYFNKLQEKYVGLVSELVGEEVEPAYNFLSLYNNLGVCEPHMDAPLAKWTLDICIDQSDEWPIHFSQVLPWPETLPVLEADWQNGIKNHPMFQFKSFTLQPCDAILFSGSSQWHYRDRIPRKNKNNFCHLLFLHFIPKGARDILNPAAWAEMFQVEELASLQDC